MTASGERLAVSAKREGNHHVKKVPICLLLTALLLTVSFADAQQPTKIYRVGYIGSVRGGLTSTEGALRSELRDLGYREGQNIVIESRSAERKFDRLPGLIADLIRLNVDVIVVTSIQGALAAKKATQSIPIVFAVAQDPVMSGLVDGLAQPGGNLTGVTDFARELAGKRLELLKETAPRIFRVAVLSWKPAGPDYTAEKSEIELAARAMRVDLQPVVVKEAKDLDYAFSVMSNGGVNAFMAMTDTRFANNRKRIIELVGPNCQASHPHDPNSHRPSWRPVQLGFVASLARPGGNITGFSTISSRLAGKWLELLKEAFPQIARVAFVRDARNPGTVDALKELDSTAQVMGVQVKDLGLRRADDLENTMQAARNWRAEGLIVMAAGVFVTRRDRERFAKLEIKSRLPAMHSAPEIVQVGGLMSYFTDVPEQFRRAATYVDKILKGSNTAELPVEQPTKFECQSQNSQADRCDYSSKRFSQSRQSD